MTTPDFTLVGPPGFVLGKPRWLERYRDGDLVTGKLDWTEVEVRDYGGATGPDRGCLRGIVNARSADTFSYRANRMVFSGSAGVFGRPGKRLQAIKQFHEPIAGTASSDRRAAP